MIVIDLETSGVDPSRHSILSIGAVDFSNPKNQFYMECRIRENAEIDLEALAANGFTMKSIKDKSKSSLRDVLLKFCKWAGKIEDRTIAGHNVQFDIRFLKHSLRLYGIDYSVGSRCVDTHALVYAHSLRSGTKIPLKGRSSDITSAFVAEYCGLPEEPSPHNGLSGAKIEAEELSRLIHGRNLIEEYKKFDIPKYLK
jgi:DNA polymerase III epsilon subunit-like protein